LTIHPIENMYLEGVSEGAAAIAFALWIYLDYSKRIELNDKFIKRGRNKISLSSVSKCVKKRVYSNVISNKKIEDELNEGSIEYVVYDKDGKSVLSIQECYYFQDSDSFMVFMDFLKYANIPFVDDSKLQAL